MLNLINTVICFRKVYIRIYKNENFLAIIERAPKNSILVIYFQMHYFYEEFDNKASNIYNSLIYFNYIYYRILIKNVINTV